MSFTNALYYPWIEVRDEKWLRTACLYWDKIHTIVPSSLNKPYSKRLSRELEDAGVLEPLRVHSRRPEIEALTADVLAYLDSQEAMELMLKRSPGRLSRIHLEKLPYSLRHLSRLHADKMAWEIRERLSRIGRSHGEWLDLNPEFADFYMTLLASRLAEQRGFGLLTASVAADRLANTARSGSRGWNLRLSDDRLIRPKLQDRSARVPRSLIEGTIVDLVLDGLTIAPNVPLKTLLAFRSQYADELGRLRKKIGELTSQVPEQTSLEAARQHSQDIVKNEVMPALGDLRAALKGQRIRTLSEGLLKVSFLSAAPTSALVMAGLAVPTALLVGAGISLTAAAVLHSEDKRQLRRENTFSYLLAVEKKFA
jgi:hypothetical protein